MAEQGGTDRSGPRAKRGGGKGVLLGSLGVFAVAGLAWWIVVGPTEPPYAGPTGAVARGRLRISVTETGTIEAREKVVLKCEVDERNTTITYIVPEGALVQKGDLLVELDASVLQDELYDEEIDVLDTEAEYLAGKEDLEVVKNQAQADVSAAELTLRFAREDVKKYVEGEYPKQAMEARNNVKLAEEEMQQARDRLEWSQRLFDRGFLSGSELDRDRLSFQSAELEVELARAEVELLDQYTHGRQLAQLEADVEQAELALERIRRSAKANITQAETNLRVRAKQLERQQAQLADIEYQVERCNIYAPVGGMVVYATTGRGGWGGNEEPLAVGREVSEQEELIHIPVADAKTAQVKVHESALDKVQLGQEVLITVDAMQGHVFRGEVARISPLPDAETQWLNPDIKVYATDVHVLGDLTGLRTGMTCRVEILIEEYQDAVYVPLHSVVRVGDQPTVFVVEGERLVRRPVEVGLDNNRMIRIVSGLSEGERVALAPPLDDVDDGKKREDEPSGEGPGSGVVPGAEELPADGAAETAEVTAAPAEAGA